MYSEKIDNINEQLALINGELREMAKNIIKDIFAIDPKSKIGFTEDIPGDALILYYVSSFQGLLELMKPNNGSDFVVDEVCEFYKMY